MVCFGIDFWLKKVYDTWSWNMAKITILTIQSRRTINCRKGNVMALASVLVIVGVVVFAIGLWGCIAGPRGVLAIALLLCGFLCAVFSAPSIGRNKTYGIIAQEVDMTNVPVVGQKNFIVEVLMTYENGKLIKVLPVSKTVKSVIVEK